MKIEINKVGNIETNCYLVINEETKETIVIDPGEDGDFIGDRINSQGLKCTAILYTHGHFDHATGTDDLKKALGYETKVYANSLERELLMDSLLNHSEKHGLGSRQYPADIYIEDGEVLSLAGFDIRAISTPGHTPGGMCYYFPDEGVLFSGDTLFNGSVGRTDFAEGDFATLVKSIVDKLYTLPEETKVYPGHMGDTTIGKEKTSNPYVR